MHAETGQTPLARFEAGGPPRSRPTADLAEAFRWSVCRTVTNTAIVPLEGNQYPVDPALARRRVELLYDPLDLTVLYVRLDGKHAGAATPHHSPGTPTPGPPGRPRQRRRRPRATGVDYLALVGERTTGRGTPGQLHRPQPPQAATDPPASGQPGQDQDQGQDEQGAGEEDGRG